MPPLVETARSVFEEVRKEHTDVTFYDTVLTISEISKITESKDCIGTLAKGVLEIKAKQS